MPYTTPRTWADGQLVTAAQLNTDVRDNTAFVYGMANGGARNVLANPAFQVSTMTLPATEWAGGTGSFTSTGATLPSWFDRWFFYYDYGQLATVSPLQVATTFDVPPGVNTPASMVFKVNSGASPAAANVAGFGQILYTDELYRLGLGQAGNRPLQLSFWVKSSVAGTYVVSLYSYNPSNYGFVSGAYTVNAANTWEFKTITFPNIPSGSAFWTNSNYAPYWTGIEATLAIRWGLGAGTNWNSGTLNTSAWTTSSTGTRYAGQVNFMGTTGNTIKIAAPQLEQGTEVTPFQMNHPEVDRAVCGRQVFVPKGEILVRASSASQLVGHVNLPYAASGQSYFPWYTTTGSIVNLTIADTGSYLGAVNVSNVLSIRNPGNNHATFRLTLSTASATAGTWYVIDANSNLGLMWLNTSSIWFQK